MSWSFDGRGCFPTGRHYPGIAHLVRISEEGLASEWSSSEAIADIPWVSIDTETTGRSADDDRVVEVACITMRAGKVVMRQSWLVNPERPIPKEASDVHGILDADVAGKPTFAEIAEDVLAALSTGLPLAYNAEFDRGFLLAEFARAGVDVSLAPGLREATVWLDPLDWARELQREHKSRALGEVATRLGIALESAHRAADDAEAAGHVLYAFLRDARVPATYGAFIKEQRRLSRMFEFERARFYR